MSDSTGLRPLPTRMTNNDPDAKNIRVYLDGIERRGDVVEFDVEGGWIRKRVMVGYGRFAKPHYATLFGKVTVEWK